jgi:hypothetical protein
MWWNHVFLGKRGMLWKPTKLAHLYLFITTWRPILCIVIPKCTRCLCRRTINMGAQCMNYTYRLYRWLFRRFRAAICVLVLTIQPLLTRHNWEHHLGVGCW